MCLQGGDNGETAMTGEPDSAEMVPGNTVLLAVWRTTVRG